MDFAVFQGSSPHTRGALALASHAMRASGIIPAYAGSTSHRSSGSDRMPDHPRIRGEHLYGAGGRRTGYRIIPAYAGSTKRAFKNARIVVGSSPHTRGAPEDTTKFNSMERIIPAYAGSTSLGCSGSGLSPDHPRIRGEHSRDLTCRLILLGSSPHTRGARETERVLAKDPGIIPAYAGSTFAPGEPPVGAGDHPRIRGEHRPRISTPFSSDGSSPHTRGALARGGFGRPASRIIPAYAGSTRRFDGENEGVPDHPRIRGEHSRRGRVR